MSTAHTTALLVRARARRSAGGAIIFVTAMTLALLASLGLYALSATRAEVRASGYMTRTNMTEGLQQWALNATMGSFNVTGAQTLIGQSINKSSYDPSSSTPMHGCQALATVPPSESVLTKACLRQPLASFLNASEGTAPPVSWSTPGRSYQADIDLFSEITNADQPLTMPKGTGLNASAYRLVTVTTYGILRMHNSFTAGTSNTIVHQGRAHLVVGPINCNLTTPC